MLRVDPPQGESRPRHELSEFSSSFGDSWIPSVAILILTSIVGQHCLKRPSAFDD